MRPLMLLLKLNPLRFEIELDGVIFQMPMNRAAAQALYLALLPHVAGEIEPELALRIEAETAAFALKDSEFLKELGVSDERPA